MTIAFRSVGTLAGASSGSVAAPTPAGTASGDIILIWTLQRHSSSSSSNSASLSGGDASIFTKLLGYNTGITGSGQHQFAVWIGRRGASYTAPTVDYTTGGLGNFVNSIAFSDSNPVPSGDYWEDLTQGGPSAASPYGGTVIDTTAADRMAIQFGVIDDNNAVGAITGGTPATWAGDLQQSSAGNDGSLTVEYKAVPTAQTVTGPTRTVSNDWHSFAFAIFGASAKSVVAASGSYALTGTAATLKVARKAAAAAGSFSLTGTAATLKVGHKVAAAAGSFAVAGTSVALLEARKLSAESGAFDLAGTDASLIEARKVAAEAGAYALTGADAGLRVSRRVVGQAGSFDLSGSDVAITIFAGLGLSAGAGSYALTGQPASVLRTRLVTAEPGAFSLSGADAHLALSEAQPEQPPGGGDSTKSYRRKTPKVRTLREIVGADAPKVEVPQAQPEPVARPKRAEPKPDFIGPLRAEIETVRAEQAAADLAFAQETARLAEEARIAAEAEQRFRDDLLMILLLAA